jgi:hypothetical protein
MKIAEILLADQDDTPENVMDASARIPDQDLMAHIANAFTHDRAVKLLWDLHMADGAPAPETPDARTSQGAEGAPVNPLASSSEATRGVRFTPPF